MVPENERIKNLEETIDTQYGTNILPDNSQLRDTSGTKNEIGTTSGTKTEIGTNSESQRTENTPTNVYSQLRTGLRPKKKNNIKDLKSYHARDIEAFEKINEESIMRVQKQKNKSTTLTQVGSMSTDMSLHDYEARMHTYMQSYTANWV